MSDERSGGGSKFRALEVTIISAICCVLIGRKSLLQHIVKGRDRGEYETVCKNILKQLHLKNRIYKVVYLRRKAVLQIMGSHEYGRWSR